MEDKTKTITEHTSASLLDGLSEETGRRLLDLFAKSHLDKAAHVAQAPVIKIKNSQIAAGVIGTAGFVIFALGIERTIEHIPVLSSPLSLIIFGLILLSASGLLLKKLS